MTLHFSCLLKFSSDDILIFCLLQGSGLVTHSLSDQTVKYTSATASEKQLFLQLLEKAKNTFQSRIKLVTTDGHTGILAHMRDKEKTVVHNQVSKCIPSNSARTVSWCSTGVYLLLLIF